MMKHNLSPKLITEFSAEDTIYITRPEDKRKGTLSRTYLCQFVSTNGASVTGRVILCETDSREKGEDGKEISESLGNCSLYGENPVSGHSSFHHFNKSGYAIMPYEYDKESENANIVESHPSFGLVCYTKHTGSTGPLFGSSLMHSGGISLTVHTAKVERKLGTDWYHPGRRVIEIAMSSAQFAEFMTSPNQGSGVPCTIRYIPGMQVPDPPYEPKHNQSAKEFRAIMNNMAADMDNIKNTLADVLAKPNIGKKDREDIADMFNQFTRALTDKVPFVNEQFGKYVQKTVDAAKMDLEAALAMKTGISSGDFIQAIGFNGENQKEDGNGAG